MSQNSCQDSKGKAREVAVMKEEELQPLRETYRLV